MVAPPAGEPAMPLRSLPTPADRPTHGPLALAFIAGAGFLLVWCSYIFDRHAVIVLLQDFGMTHLLPGHDITLAEALAAALNAAKIALSLIIANRLVAGLWTLGPKLARFLVLALSLTLALVVFGSETISPNARAAYEARLTEATATRDAARTDLATRFEARADEITRGFDADRTMATDAATTRIAELEELLDAERLIGDQDFRGARYIQLETDLAAATAALAARLDGLRAEEQAALAALAAERATALAAIDTAHDQAVDAIDLGAIAGEAEAQHPAIVAFAKIAATLLGRDSVDPILITVALSVMTTLVLELLPMILLTHAFREAGEAKRVRGTRAEEARPNAELRLVRTAEKGKDDQPAAA